MALGIVNVPGAAGMDTVEAKKAAQAAAAKAEAAQTAASAAAAAAESAEEAAQKAEGSVQEVAQAATAVYWATYDETTFEDVRAAFLAGKTVLCRHGNWVEVLQICTSTYARFVGQRAEKGFVREAVLNADGWNYDGYYFVPTARQINGRELNDDIELGATYTVTLAADGWTESGDWLVQTVSVPGLLAQYNAAPLVDVALSGQDAEADAEIAAAWAQISGQMVAETDADVLAIQLPASVGAPEVNIPVRITVYD